MTFILAALLTGASALASSTASAAPAVQSAPVRSEAMSRDDRGRPQIAVSINDAGPFPMVVDTAAQASLLAPSLAEELHLAPMPADFTINGVTGATRAQLYPVDHLSSALFDKRRVAVLMLPEQGTTSARGILGMEHFADGKLTFDRTGGRLTFGPSSPAPKDYVAHAGEVRGGSLLVVPLVLNGVTVKATVDSGAGVTLAGPAVLKALGWKADDPRLVAAGAVRGATSQASAIRGARLETLQLGPVRLSNVPIFFTGGDETEDQEPMVILGADLLGLLDAYALDFPRGELQIRIPPRK